jgi:hypothetical protein
MKVISGDHDIDCKMEGFGIMGLKFIFARKGDWNVNVLTERKFSNIALTLMKYRIPFEFVLEELDRIHPRVKPMFGCYAIYVGEKLVLILRQRNDFIDDNGVWLAVLHEHHASLKKDFPCMRSVRLLGSPETVWQNISADQDDFEELVLKACHFILKSDVRIGKVPKQKKKLRKKE